MFYDPNTYLFTQSLERHWETIRDEYLRLRPEQLMPWPETTLYQGSWDVFGLWAFGSRLDENRRACPKTTEILEQIPGLTTAGFSRLAPRTRIAPHEGYTATVLRCHLGLIVPEHCGLQVGAETRTWTEGGCLVFDDTIRHSAWNEADQERIILLIDFLKDKKWHDARVSPEVAAALLKADPREISARRHNRHDA